MKKLIILFALVISFSVNLLAQNKFSLQLNGGYLSPVNNSSNGLLGSIQIDYNSTGDIYFYLYSGIGAWDKTYFLYHDSKMIVDKKAYSEGSHTMVPLYAGARFIINRNKILDLFIDGEAGIVFLNYTNYNLKLFTNPDGSINYLPVSNSKESEALFGIGTGVGISHTLENKVLLLLELKINTMTNSAFSNLFDAAGTSTSIQFGIEFNI
ncbi:MAG: hypothetical protein ACYC6P_06505 [Ignavibacteriaceae bacterium]